MIAARLGDPPPAWTREFSHVEIRCRQWNHFSWRAYAIRSMLRDVSRVRRSQRNRDREGWWDLGGEA